MFGPRFNEQKLKVNLGLVVTRLKLIEKKKTDQALRARPEIAEYVRNAKIDRARVRVEHIIREDYLVEAMELVEMYADLLAGRVGLMKQSKVLDESLKTPISTLIWATPRLQQYCQELKVVHDLLGAYYGKKYVEACRANQVGTVCERVIQKMDLSPPKKLLVERYLIEICKAADVEFTPDPRIMAEELQPVANIIDTDFMDFNRDFPGSPGGGGGGGGGGGVQMIPSVPSFSYAAAASAPETRYREENTYDTINIANNLPPYTPTDPNANPGGQKSYPNQQEQKQPPALPKQGPSGSPNKIDLSNDPSGISATPPAYNGSLAPESSNRPVAAPRNSSPSIPNLPSVPTNLPGSNTTIPPGPGGGSSTSTNDDVDFDDLSRRFENLRKKT